MDWNPPRKIISFRLGTKTTLVTVCVVSYAVIRCNASRSCKGLFFGQLPLRTLIAQKGAE